MKSLFIFLTFLWALGALAQPAAYTVNNAHSHNDYEQDIPFWMAYHAGFASIEADIFLVNGRLLVGHEAKYLQDKRTLQALYLDPIRDCIEKNSGFIFADTTKQLQFLIDIKSDSIQTLKKFIEVIEQYPSILACPRVKFVITGNRPASSLFNQYPAFIRFDGEAGKTYSMEALSRVAMVSADLKNYAGWNGKGRPVKAEFEALQSVVNTAHALHKPVRFWGAPDMINAWYQLMHLKVDFINTDLIYDLSSFLRRLDKTAFVAPAAYKVYQPSYKTDGDDKRAKNVIILIGDGTGLAQLYAGYTANKGALNIFNMRNLGISKTSSYDSYTTDSAPGSTAISAGVKTNNRSVGVDHTGAALPLLPHYLAAKKIKSGVITCGDIADATPADFYAHQVERTNSASILQDLRNADINLLMGADDQDPENMPAQEKPNSYRNQIKSLQTDFTVVPSMDSITTAGKKWIVIDQEAARPALRGRGNWLERAFTKSIQVLSENKQGFLLVAEGAQVDHGGHDNNLPYVASEVMDFDQVVGRALQFADENMETLVIVTADHETGGLSLLDGDYNKGYVSGQFSTNDHTAIPVTVFAYGPQSQLFRGVYENTALFNKILQAYGINISGNGH